MAVKKQFSNLQELLQRAEVPVLVDFYAPWCGPCQMMAPILSQLSQRLGSQLQVAKIDTDRYPQLASQYGVRTLPTLVLFRDGQPADRIEGLMQAEELIGRLQPQLDAAR